jgi:hypothetical protein
MHMQDGFFDEPLGGLRMDFGRMPGGSRRLMGGRLADRPPAAAAGVWDDTGDAMDALPDPMMTGGLGGGRRQAGREFFIGCLMVLGLVLCNGKAWMRGMQTRASAALIFNRSIHVSMLVCSLFAEEG